MTTTATHLRTIALHWTDLHEAAGQPAQIGAFGLGLRGYLARLDQADAEQLEYEHHQAAHLRSLERDPIQLGDRPVPVRLHILDTMRAVEATLVQCADDIAASAQRAPIPMPAARRVNGSTYRSLREACIAHEDRQRRVQLALADQRDPKRWRYTGRRTAPHAALWLLARVERAAGPCRRITEGEEQRIGTVAAGAPTGSGGPWTSLRRSGRWNSRMTAADPSTCTAVKAGRRSRTARGAEPSGRRPVP